MLPGHWGAAQPSRQLPRDLEVGQPGIDEGLGLCWGAARQPLLGLLPCSQPRMKHRDSSGEGRASPIIYPSTPGDLHHASAVQQEGEEDSE